MSLAALPIDTDAAVRGVSPPIARILERALEGRELSRAEGLALVEAPPSALEALVAVADDIRCRRVGDVVTDVVN